MNLKPNAMVLNFRQQWRRSLIELNGKFDAKYRHSVSDLLIQSYSEVPPNHIFVYSFRLNFVNFVYALANFLIEKKNDKIGWGFSAFVSR